MKFHEVCCLKYFCIYVVVLKLFSTLEGSIQPLCREMLTHEIELCRHMKGKLQVIFFLMKYLNNGAERFTF